MNKHTKSAEFWSKEYQEIKQEKDKLEHEAHYNKELIASHEHSLDNLYRENQDLLIKVGQLVSEKNVMENNFRENLEKWKRMVQDENSKFELKHKELNNLKAQLDEAISLVQIKGDQINALEDTISKARQQIENLKQENYRFEERDRGSK